MTIVVVVDPVSPDSFIKALVITHAASFVAGRATVNQGLVGTTSV
jgi:hypothetical protein